MATAVPSVLIIYSYETDDVNMIIMKFKSKVKPFTTFHEVSLVFEEILILILLGLVCFQQVSCTLYED